MRSHLNVDTIVDKAGSGGSNVKMANTSTYVSDGGAVTQNTVQGLCKQWIKFSSVDHSTADSFNTTSITDNGTADTTITIANDMASANYSIGALGTDYHITEKDYNGTDPTATLYRLYNFLVSSTNGSTTANEEDRVYAHVFGDLA